MNKLLKNNKKKKGFTLIELIVVIAILGILAAIGTPIILGQITKANDQARMSEASAIFNAAQLYYVNEDTEETTPASGAASDAAITAIKGMLSSNITGTFTVTFDTKGVLAVAYTDSGKVANYPGGTTTAIPAAASSSASSVA